MSTTADQVLDIGGQPLPKPSLDGNCNDLKQTGYPTNWPLLLLIFFVPLQNIVFQYMPMGPGGLNFLNVFFLLSWMVASKIKGQLSDFTNINGWVTAYLVWGFLCLFIGYSSVTSGSEKHFNAYKDQTIGVALFFIVQMSVRDWTALRRIALATLLPLAYIARVTIIQNRSIGSWHYDDDLRISGTFMMLGANEMAAFAVTTFCLSLGLLFVLKRDRIWTGVLIVGLLSAGACIMYGYSRTSYVAIAVAVIALYLSTPRKGALFLPLLFGGIITSAVMPQSVHDRLESLTVSSDEADGSTQSRFIIWDIAFDRWKSSPVTGIGYHSFHHKENNPLGKDTHNYFVLMLVERGIVGFVIYVMMMWVAWSSIRKVYRLEGLPLWGRALTVAMTGVILGVSVGCTFGDRFSHYPMIGIFWVWLALVLKVPDLMKIQADAKSEKEDGESRELAI